MRRSASVSRSRSPSSLPRRLTDSHPRFADTEGLLSHQGGFNLVTVNPRMKLALRTPRSDNDRTVPRKDAIDGARLARMMGIVGVGPKIRGYSMTSSEVGTLQESYDGSLHHLLFTSTFSASDIQAMAEQLKYLICTVADLGFVLLDLKPANIVVRRSAGSLELKFIDFDTDFLSSISQDRSIIEKISDHLPKFSTRSACNVLRLLYVLIMYGQLLHFFERPDVKSIPAVTELNRAMKSTFTTLRFPFYVIDACIKGERLQRRLTHQIKHSRYVDLSGGGTGLTYFFGVFMKLSETSASSQISGDPVVLMFDGVDYRNGDLSAANRDKSRLYISRNGMLQCKTPPPRGGRVVEVPESIGVALDSNISSDFSNEAADLKDRKTESHWRHMTRLYQAKAVQEKNRKRGHSAVGV